MLQKRQRLRRANFDDVFTSGRRIHSPVMTLIYAPGETFHGSVVVGKKVAKGAVVRNQLRRQIYGILYRLQTEKGLTGTYIILTKPAIKAVPRKQLGAEVAALVGRSSNKR